MVGRTISHYEILAALGEGGMGVVYKARDLRLGRSVALKMLHPARSADPERKRRFVQEAKAVSALNHPNIVTIYDIGSEAGVDFIVMEHVVGKPLSQVIPQSGMRVTDALAVAIPIADALARAHNAGIVHRDLKPANLMLGTDGVPKLLDFGLAKLVERVAPADDVSVVATGEMTAPIEDGLILGTLSYMSPEQAEGRDVDARSDIFSFGAVLYQMVTGQPAFRGESPLSTLAAILHADPRPADEVAPGVPRPLGRLITRCLRKDPAKRWQSIADVRTSLEEIKQDSDSVEAGASAATRQSLLQKHPNVLWAVVASAAVIGIGAAAVWIRSTSAPEPAAEMLPPVPITTYAGSESSPSFSPDGSQFAFVWDGERQDNRDIYIKRFDSNPPLRLTRDSAEDDHPVWSPDGGSIAFVRRRLDVTGWKSEVVVVPSLGGPEHVLIDDDRVDSGTLDWSPDGKWLICGCPPAGEPEGLWVRSVENGEHHRLTLSKEFDREARFSPDGRSLAFVRGLSNSTDLYVLNLDASMRASGDPRRLTTDGLRHHSPQWLGNGRELVFTMGVFGAGYIGRIAAAGGRVRRVTTIDAPGGIAVSPRSNRLLISRSTSDLDIYRVELSPDGVAQTPAQSPVPVIASSQVRHRPRLLAERREDRVRLAPFRRVADLAVRQRRDQLHPTNQAEGWRSPPDELAPGGWTADRVLAQRRWHHARLHGCGRWRHSRARAGIGQCGEPRRVFLVVAQRQLGCVYDRGRRLEDADEGRHTSKARRRRWSARVLWRRRLSNSRTGIGSRHVAQCAARRWCVTANGPHHSPDSP